MARAWQQRDLDRTIAFLLGNLDLFHGAVLVVLALHDQNGHADVSEELCDVPLAELRVEPGTVPTLERAVDVVVPAREPRPQIAGFIGFSRLGDCGDTGILGEEMRCNQHEAADPVILVAARVNRRDGGPVAVADQEPAPEADGIEQLRQGLAGFVVHIRERARQADRARFSIARARIDEHAGTRRSRKFLGKIVPQTDTAQAFVQQHEGWHLVRLRPDEAVFDAMPVNIEKPGFSKCHQSAPGPSARSLKRWIFPVAVFGRSLRNSIQRGYLYGASFAWTSASFAFSGALSTTKAFGLISFCSSFQPTTAASSTSGCEDSAASTSKGETYMPDTFNMSSWRPQHTKYPSSSSIYLSPERVHSPWNVERDFS